MPVEVEGKTMKDLDAFQNVGDTLLVFALVEPPLNTRSACLIWFGLTIVKRQVEDLEITLRFRKTSNCDIAVSDSFDLQPRIDPDTRRPATAT